MVGGCHIPKNGKQGQPYGEEATAYLKRLVLNQVVVVYITGAKTDKREICLLLAEGKRNINLEMVKAGYAWAYKQFLRGPYASEYLEAEALARSKRSGLWRQSDPQPPWEYRKLLRRSM